MHRTSDGRLAVDVAVENGITTQAFWSRMAMGWSADTASSRPVRAYVDRGMSAAERSRLHAGIRRAELLDATVHDIDHRVVWERDGGVCHLCLQPADQDDWHLDHVIALKQGGLHAYGNVAVACPPCNRTKSGRSYSGRPERMAAALLTYALR